VDILYKDVMGRATATPTISGETLRARIDRLGLIYSEAATRLGLTRDGLNKQMRGIARVSRQTELLLGYVEKEQLRREPKERRARSRRPPSAANVP
jgi:hypothetical protein